MFQKINKKCVALAILCGLNLFSFSIFASPSCQDLVLRRTAGESDLMIVRDNPALAKQWIRNLLDDASYLISGKTSWLLIEIMQRYKLMPNVDELYSTGGVKNFKKQVKQLEDLEKETQTNIASEFLEGVTGDGRYGLDVHSLLSGVPLEESLSWRANYTLGIPLREVKVARNTVKEILAQPGGQELLVEFIRRSFPDLIAGARQRVQSETDSKLLPYKLVGIPTGAVTALSSLGLGLFFQQFAFSTAAVSGAAAIIVGKLAFDLFQPEGDPSRGIRKLNESATSFRVWMSKLLNRRTIQRLVKQGKISEVQLELPDLGNTIGSEYTIINDDALQGESNQAVVAALAPMMKEFSVNSIRSFGTEFMPILLDYSDRMQTIGFKVGTMDAKLIFSVNDAMKTVDQRGDVSSEIIRPITAMIEMRRTHLRGVLSEIENLRQDATVAAGKIEEFSQYLDQKSTAFGAKDNRVAGALTLKMASLIDDGEGMKALLETLGNVEGGILVEMRLLDQLSRSISQIQIAATLGASGDSEFRTSLTNIKAALETLTKR